MNPPHLGEATIGGKRLAVIVAGLMLTLFLAALEGTIVATAMPRIVADLNGFDKYSWVATAYLLASTAVVPIVSKLSDIYGRKRQLMVSLVGFVAGSALCGFAQTMEQLILFRAIQGLAGGGLFSLVFAANADIFPPAERGKWQGLFFGMITTAIVLGPPIGGFLTETLSWRWVFYVNIPLCLVVLTILALGFPGRPAPAPGGWRRIDIRGAMTLTLGVTALLLAIVTGGERLRWLDPAVLGLFAISALAFVAFFWTQRRSREPIVPLDLLRHRVIAVGAAASFLVSFLMVATSLYSPLYIQAILGDTPTASGITLLPQILTGLLFNVIGGQIVSRRGRYRQVMLIGGVLMPLGLLSLALTAPQANRWWFIGSLMLFSAGFSMMTPQLNVAIQNALPMSRMGAGTGMVTLIRSIGQTMGAAVVGTVVVTVYLSTLGRAIPPAAAALPADVLGALTDPQHFLVRGAAPAAPPADLDPALARQVVDAVGIALISGLDAAFVTMFLVGLLASLIVFFLPDAQLRRGRPAATTANAVPLAPRQAAPAR
ncbi:MAG: MDR family MFS transporter [Chloroflexota bacterium]|nr:MFS transporter [Dehalococcoidia bacterium]MDW8252946.1 MDR family MFS transporter [Chloroflexota bacterium]